MKKIILSFLVLLFIGCNKDELDEYPKLIEPVKNTFEWMPVKLK